MSQCFQTDRGKRKLDEAGPAPSDIRKIPFFGVSQAAGPGRPAVEVDSGPAKIAS